MQIFARHELATNVPSNGHARLLLEGSWPAAAADAKKNQLLALDDLFDGRHAAIDAEAERLAERIAAAVRRPSPDQPSFADVNILRLRYAAVKWLRPLAWRRSLSPAMRPQHYDLHVSTDGEDAEYSALWQALAAADGCELQTVEAPTTQTDSPSAPFNNSAWRRRLARWSESLRQLRATGNSPTRVLLCGNPRLLDPLCAEFVRRGISTAWLYDRFAVQSGVRWSLRGVPRRSSTISPRKPTSRCSSRPARPLPSCPAVNSFSVATRATPAMRRSRASYLNFLSSRIAFRLVEKNSGNSSPRPIAC